MASFSWPNILPSGMLEEGFIKEPQDNVIRTNMDAGPQKARRRYTARTFKYTGKQIFDAEELAVFEWFFRTELADGVLRFTFSDPVTMETAEFRFTDRYTVSAVEGLFEVSLPLERL